MPKTQASHSIAESSEPGSDSLLRLSNRLMEFAQDRNWLQFHSPKNLASALIVESAELLEPFQWLTESQSRELSEQKLIEVGDEMADVLLYLVQLANILKVDLIAAANSKIDRNALRFPTNLNQGSAEK